MFLEERFRGGFCGMLELNSVEVYRLKEEMKGKKNKRKPRTGHSTYNGKGGGDFVIF